MLNAFDQLCRNTIVYDTYNVYNMAQYKVIIENLMILYTNLYSQCNHDYTLFGNYLNTLNFSLTRINSDFNTTQTDIKTILDSNINLITHGYTAVRSRTFYSKPKESIDEYLQILFNLYMSLSQHNVAKLDEYKQQLDSSILTTISWGYKHPLNKNIVH